MAAIAVSLSLHAAADYGAFFFFAVGSGHVVNLSRTVVLSSLAEFVVKSGVNRMLIHLMLPQ